MPVRIRQLVRVAEALADLVGDERRGGDGKSLALLLQRLGDRLQVRAVDVLHDDEVGVVADADVEDLHAVRVRELGGEARLVEEHRDEFFFSLRCGRTRLIATCLRKPWSPSLSARNTSAMPPDSSFSTTRSSAGALGHARRPESVPLGAQCVKKPRGPR